jgi:hypothetical protein
MEKFAVLSKSAYDFYYQDRELVKKELEHYGLDHYKLREDLSDKEVGVVLESPDDIVISYRGTDLKNPSDLFADWSILMGRHRNLAPSSIEDRFFRADQLYQNVKSTTTKPITLTGHSLGNTLALYTGRKNDVESIGFNPGASYNDVIIGLMCKMFGNCDKDAHKHTIYTTGRDLISMGNVFGNENIIKIDPTNKTKKGYLYHSLEYFMPERPIEREGRPSYFNPIKHVSRKRQKYLDIETIEQFKELQHNVSLRE